MRLRRTPGETPIDSCIGQYCHVTFGYAGHAHFYKSCMKLTATRERRRKQRCRLSARFMPEPLQALWRLSTTQIGRLRNVHPRMASRE
jgi:hypothetical protein